MVSAMVDFTVRFPCVGIDHSGWSLVESAMWGRDTALVTPAPLYHFHRCYHYHQCYHYHSSYPTTTSTTRDLVTPLSHQPPHSQQDV